MFKNHIIVLILLLCGCKTQEINLVWQQECTGPQLETWAGCEACQGMCDKEESDCEGAALDDAGCLQEMAPFSNSYWWLCPHGGTTAGVAAACGAQTEPCRWYCELTDCGGDTGDCGDEYIPNYEDLIDNIIDVELIDDEGGEEIVNPTIEFDGIDITNLANVTIVGNVIRIESVLPRHHLITIRAAGYGVRSIRINVSRVPEVQQEVRVMMRPGALVSGVVQWYNDYYNPIEYAKVMLVSLSDKTIAYATTNEYGEFEFPGVSAGSYRVYATATGYSTKELPVFTTDGETAVHDVDFTYLSNGDAGIISGSVTYNNVPQADVTVRIALSDVSSSRARLPLDVVTFKNYIETTTDEYGEFEITTAPREFVRIGAFDGTYVSDATTLDLKNNSSLNSVEIELFALSTIAGTVEDGEETPLEGARVIALPTVQLPLPDSIVLDLPRAAVTDEYGSFSLQGLPSGDYDLYATTEGNFGISQSPLETTFAGADGVELIIEDNGSISGTIGCDNNETPETCDSDVFQIGISEDSLVTFSGTYGEFEIPNLPPGTYTLFIKGEFFPSTILTEIEVVAHADTDLGRIVVRDDNEVTNIGALVEGLIIDEYLDPVPNAIVSLGYGFTGDGVNIENHWPIRTTITDEYGNYYFEGIYVDDIGEDSNLYLVVEYGNFRSQPTKLSAKNALPFVLDGC